MGDLVQNAGHIVDKAHVQHPVRLVQHHGLHLTQSHGAALHVVGQAARRGHHDLGPPLQDVDLLGNGLSAVEAHQADPLMAHGDLAHFVGDLHGQLPGGGQNHRLHVLTVRVDALDDGDAEGHGLAGAGGGLGDDVLSRQHGGDAPGLNGGADLVSFVPYGAHGGLGQAKAVKGRALCKFHSSFLFFLYNQPCYIITYLSICPHTAPAATR